MINESSKLVVRLMLSAFLSLMVPTGILVLRNNEVTESINRCANKDDEKNTQVNRRDVKRRRIKFYLKLNLPVVTKTGNRTKVIPVTDLDFMN